MLLAPFQVLASEGRTWADRDHGWHLEVADRLVAQAPDRFRTDPRLVVDTTDAASTEAGVAWWEELTAAGGEGMVVKPVANLIRTAKGLVQPGLKVRGREYLRLIYGPDYLAPRQPGPAPRAQPPAQALPGAARVRARAWSRSTATSPASRCGACTRRSSPSSRSSRSRSTPGL